MSRRLIGFEIGCLNASTSTWPIKFIIKQIMFIYFRIHLILKESLEELITLQD